MRHRVEVDETPARKRRANRDENDRQSRTRRFLLGRSVCGGAQRIDPASVRAASCLNSTSVETKTAFAERVGLTKGRISQLVAEGLPVRADGQIDVAEGLAWIEANLDPARRYKGGAVAASSARSLDARRGEAAA